MIYHEHIAVYYVENENSCRYLNIRPVDLNRLLLGRFFSFYHVNKKSPHDLIPTVGAYVRFLNREGKIILIRRLDLR